MAQPPERMMRILFVAEDLPWPENNGYRIRLTNMLRGLADTGAVHLVAAAPPGSEHVVPPPDLPVAEVDVVPVDSDSSRAVRLWRWSRSGLPRRLVARDWSPLRAATQATNATSHFDLTWLAHAQSFVAAADVVSGPLIVDIDNLADVAIRHRRAAWRVGADRRRRLGDAASHRLDVIDERRFGRLHGEISERADALVVCSELDRERLGDSNVVVVSNGAEVPGEIAEHTPDPRHPVITMIGLLAYEANADAARYFVDTVLPILRSWAPSIELRLVGRPGPVVDTIRGTPNVTIVGEVDDVAEELARADLVAVPIRFGGGTRLKVLEAFAHRVPVVSTTVGCEGIEVVPGRDLLVADEPDAFAEACRDVIDRPELREALVTAALDLVTTRYRWEEIRQDVADLARSLAPAWHRGGS